MTTEIKNKRAYFDYFIEDTYEVGIELKGTEVKSIRAGHAQLKDSYAVVRQGEVFVLNLYISPYDHGNQFNQEATRTRKLLLHKKEIRKIEKSKIDGYTVIPLRLYFKRGRVKLLLGLAKGKKNFDKRESIKQRDIERDMKRSIKEY